MRKKWDSVVSGMRRTVAAVSALAFLAGGLPYGPASQAYAAAAGDESAVFKSLSSGTRIEAEREPYKEPDVPTVYLTFDDGPSKLTGQVLDILKQEQIKATFFVLGEHAEERRDLIKRMVEEGHAVGNHSYNHVYEELYKNFNGFWKQAVQTDRVIEDITGRKPFLLRAPGGTATNFDSFYFYYLEQAGYTVVDWNVDSGDAVRKGVQAGEILETIRKSPLKKELTVLIHDGTGHEESVKALPGIIAYYKDKGYTFAAIGEEVQPAQFRLTASKWARTYTMEGFKSLSAETAATASDRGTQWAEDKKSELRLAQQGEEAAAEAAEALERAGGQTKPEAGRTGVPTAVKPGAVPPSYTDAATAPMLRIRIGGGAEWSLPKEEYGFDHDRFTVPLQELAVRLGGTYAWDEIRKVASVRSGSREVEFDPVHRQIRELSTGQKRITHYLADMAWSDGSVRVPLRATTALLGGEVTSYSLGNGEFRVELGLRSDSSRLTAWFQGRIGEGTGLVMMPNWMKLGISESHV
jgi:peptidoglycan-N-acetylglucosamine deacetylase